MTYLNSILQEHRNPNSYMSLLPTLGPLQMVTEYVDGGKPIGINPRCVGTIGELRQFPGQAPAFKQIALDSKGNIAVQHREYRKIDLFQPDSTLVKTISLPTNVYNFAIDQSNNLYVINKNIAVYDFDGSKQRDIEVPADLKFARVACTNDGSFLVTNADATSGDQLLYFDQTGQLLVKRAVKATNIPTAVAWDPCSNTFAVSERETTGGFVSFSNERISFYRYEPANRSLELVRSIATFPEITAMAFDVTGNLVVACERADVYICSPDGKHRTTLNCQGALSVAVNREGRIFIFEKKEYRLSVWQ